MEAKGGIEPPSTALQTAWLPYFSVTWKCFFVNSHVSETYPPSDTCFIALLSTLYFPAT